MSSTDNMSPAAQAAWANLTQAYGQPLKINSAYRDPSHNAKVGGAKKSQHMHGNAYDVDVSGLSEAERLNLIEQARGAGFQGIGVYDNALHFDVGSSRAWGSDYTSASVPSWAASAVGAPVGQQSAQNMPTQGQQAPQGQGGQPMNALAPQPPAEQPRGPQLASNVLDPRAFMTPTQQPQYLRFT